MTLLALYQYTSGALLDDFALPETLSRDALIGRLITECGEMEVSLANPDTMKAAVGYWSAGRLEMWEKLAAMPGYEYNPIWNVDGDTYHEGETESHGTSSGGSTEQRTYTRDRDQTDTLQNTHNDTRTPNLTETRTPNLTEQNTPAGSEETVNMLSADNVEGWSNDTKSTTTYQGRTDTKQTTGTETVTNTGTEQTTGAYTDTDTLAEDITDTESKTGTSTGQDDRSGAESWHERRQGNIGVTMTQQLLEAEKKLWTEFDLPGQIIKEFKNEFLLLVY